MAGALGIVAYTDASVYVRGLHLFRPMAAYNYVGRYRLVDIPISNMANSGIQHIHVYTNGDPKSLFEHVGGGRHYNINSKHGHVHVIPVFGPEDPEKISDMASYMANIDSIKDDINEYVVIAPVNFVYKANFSDLIRKHIESGKDVSILYHHVDLPQNSSRVKDYLNAFELELGSKKEVLGITRNFNDHMIRTDMSLETYVMSKDRFIDLIERAHAYSSKAWLWQMINMGIHEGWLDVQAIPYTHPVFPILNYLGYFHSNLDMLKETNMVFFNDVNWPIYTRTNDSPPAIYLGEGKSRAALISNGCIIKGEVYNSILGRGVEVGEGARISNSVILPGAKIGPGIMVTNAILDTECQVIHCSEVLGDDDLPEYIRRREIV